MKIEELQNKKIKISKNTITCKDDEGKTRGLVRNITRFCDLQLNKQWECMRTLKLAGIYDAGEAKNIIICDGKIYYLFNTKTEEFYEIYCKGRDGFEEEKKRYNRLQECKRRASQNGIKVVECYHT